MDDCDKITPVENFEAFPDAARETLEIDSSWPHFAWLPHVKIMDSLVYAALLSNNANCYITANWERSFFNPAYGSRCIYWISMEPLWQILQPLHWQGSCTVQWYCLYCRAFLKIINANFCNCLFVFINYVVKQHNWPLDALDGLRCLTCNAY